jgi:hypothetical protein
MMSFHGSFQAQKQKEVWGSHVRTVRRLGNRWHLWIGQEAGHEEGGVGWRIVMVKFPLFASEICSSKSREG